MPLPPLIAALLDPSRYADAPGTVQLRETHASWVLLAGGFAYKIKKPVTLPFLDYGTLEKRRTYCEKELTLNRRFAPSLYVGVERITGTASAPHWNGTGEVLEYAVKMRRFDEACRLDQVCAAGALQQGHLRAFAASLAELHRQAATASPETPFGAPAGIASDALENFVALQAMLTGEQLARLQRLRQWTEAECHRCTPLFLARKAEGRVRECHGDLHLGNLALIDGGVVPFDCIEFNEAFRWIDVASEVAFLYVDLLDHDQPGLAAWFLSEWLAVTGDEGALAVLRFYAVYRAMVRAKVGAIRAAQGDGDLTQALDYLRLAETIAWPTVPSLAITFGVSGSGKSYASRQWVLQQRSGAILRVRSDVERKRLHGLASHEASGSSLDGGIYSASSHEATYQRLMDLSVALLDLGWSVVVDAAFLRREERQRFQALAQRRGAAFSILAREAAPELLRARVLAKQEKTHDPSEATLEVLERQLQTQDPLTEAERAYVVPLEP